MPRTKEEELVDHGQGRVLLVDSEGTVISVDDLPTKIPIFPVFQRPIFPGVLTVVGSNLATSEWIRNALEDSENMVGLLLVEQGDEFSPTNDVIQVQSASEFYRIGTVAYVLRWVELPDKSCQFMMSTLQRFRVKRLTSKQKHFIGDVKYLEEPVIKKESQVKALGAAIVSSIQDLLPHNPVFAQEMNYLLSQVDINDPSTLTDLAASMTNAKSRDLQKILETLDLEKRMEKTLLLLREEYDLSLLKEKINQQIEERVSKQQREFFLREQLKAIKAELGVEDKKQRELTRFRERFASLELPEETSEKIEQELERYELLDEQSPELNVAHQYLEWLSSLPWGKYSEDQLNIDKAERVLDREHYGLEDVKKRIVEFIGVSSLKNSVRGAILCLVGPPGVGKTSLGRSIAKALNRKFYRFSIGGMYDESELKGHRRTYIGALPGRLIQGLRSVKTSNPVIMLDEIDKVGNNYRGNPFSVLLEVLDPEQNKDFLDHYLDVRYDLSNVLFIATANVLDTIPGPLLDRMEIIRLPGYIMEEKIQIAKRHLIPRILEDSGLKRGDISFKKAILKSIVINYARESGVRSLEKNIRVIARSVATEYARGKRDKVNLTLELLERYLGKAKFSDDDYHDKSLPGVARGLAWTSSGGTSLYIESAHLPAREGTLKLTGQLGDVMKESSNIAHSYVQSILEHTKADKDFFKKNSIHLHVPAGAIPKDGPSAGTTMATSLFSLALQKPVKSNLAMTGELTLTGYVLPVGGIKEKIIGARLVGIKTILMPKENEKDFDEIPGYLKEGISVHFVSHFSEIAKVALGISIHEK